MVERRDLAAHEVDPRRRRVVVRLVRADVADAVDVQEQPVRHVVVEERVEVRAAHAARRAPLPREAHARVRVGGRVRRAGEQLRRAPRRPVPALERVARADVGHAVLRHPLRRGEGVAGLVVGVGAGRLVALDAGDGRGHDDVRHGDAGEEARLVDRAVRRQLRVRENLLVHADGLDGADEIAGIEIRLVEIAAVARAAERPLLAADAGLFGFGALDPAGLERSSLHEDLLVRDRVQRGVQVLAAPGGQLRTACPGQSSRVVRLEKDVISVAVDVEPVVPVAEQRRPRGGAVASRDVRDDLDGDRVAEVLRRLQLAVAAAREVVAVRRPRAGVAFLRDKDGVVGGVAQVLPLRRRAVVRLERADVADAVEVQGQAFLRHVAGRLVEQSAKRYARTRARDNKTNKNNLFLHAAIPRGKFFIS